MADSAVAAAAKFRNVASSIERAQKPALMKAAQAGRPILLRAPGAPHMVAHRKVDVRVRAIGNNSASLKWGPPGLVRIVNDRTKAHWIRPRKFVGTRGTGRKAQKGAALLGAFGVDAHSTGRGGVKLPDGGIRRAVWHKGTTGKHFVEKGKQAALPVMKKVYAQAALSAPLKEAMK